MIQLSGTRFVVRWLAVLIGCGCISSVAAAPPAPTGTIYYRVGTGNATAINAIKANGTNPAANVLPGYTSLAWPVYGDANPAFRPSGGNSTHDRWFLYPATTGTYGNYDQGNGTVFHDFPHRDLFAVRSNPQNRSQLILVQLTDLYGVINFQPASACWSNDRNDNDQSFVACWANDIRDAFVQDEDGTTTIYRAQQVGCTMRLPITSTDIDPDFVPASPETVSEPELDDMVWPYLGGLAANDGQGIIAPNGAVRLVNNSPQSKLSVIDSTLPISGTALVVLWDGSQGAPHVMASAQWSPDGSMIAIGDNLGNIWTQPAAGASPPKKVLSTSVKSGATTGYAGPVWSPDSKYLAVAKMRTSGSSVTGSWVTRYSLSDGKIVDLVNLGTNSCNLLRWVADY